MEAVTTGKHARMSSEAMAKLIYVCANLQLMYWQYVQGKEACEELGLEWEDDDDMDDDHEIHNDEDMHGGMVEGSDFCIES